MESIRMFFSDQVYPFLHPIWTNLDFWRIAGIVQFFILILFFVFRKTLFGTRIKKRYIEFDKIVFNNGCAVLNRQELDAIFHALTSEEIEADRMRKISDCIVFFRNPANIHLINGVRIKSARFLKRLTALNAFIGRHFAEKKQSGKKSPAALVFSPAMKDAKGKKASPAKKKKFRDSRMKELKRLIQKSDFAYNAYLHSVNRKLFRK